MMKTTAILILLAGSFAAFAGEKGQKTKSATKWFAVKYKKLSSVKDIKKIKNVGLWSFGKSPDGTYDYFPNGNGRIVFKDKSWVLLISHSMHAEDGLGDLTLIRASDGKYYVNKGHVCSKLMIDSKEKITSFQTFLKATGKGPKGEPVKWKLYKGEQKR